MCDGTRDGRVWSNGWKYGARLLEGGHSIVVYDPGVEAPGARTGNFFEDLVSLLSPPRAVWSMVQSGSITNDTVLGPGDLALPRRHVGDLYLADIVVPPEIPRRSSIGLEVGPVIAKDDLLRIW